MMYKMLAYELSSKHTGLPCRQVFVTQSPELAQKVLEYYQKLKDWASEIGSLDLDASAPAMNLAQMAPRTTTTRPLKTSTNRPRLWTELQDEHFPLFMSFDEVRGGSATLSV